MKKFFIVMLPLLLASQAMVADFFAFRKLTDPKTGNVAYLLYDFHATIDENPEETDRILDEITNQHDQFLANKILFKKFKIDTSQLINELEKNIILLQKNLPHLTKQHNDLLTIIPRYNISVINEDSTRYTQEGNTQFSKKEKKILENIDELPGTIYFESYRSSTPMNGLGKKLTKEYSITTFKKIKNSTSYFYNVDNRNKIEGQTSEGEEFYKECKELDKRAILALKTLFTTYKKSKAIIAAGAGHIVNIAHDLIHHYGYQQDALVINPKLQNKRKDNTAIDEYLTALENNNYDAIRLCLINNKLSLQGEYDAVTQYPLDLLSIFRSEFIQEELIYSNLCATNLL